MPENIAALKSSGFGPLKFHLEMDSAHYYIEHATMLDRTRWAQSLSRARAAHHRQSGGARQLLSRLFARKD